MAKKKKKKKKFNENAAIRSAVRRVFSRSPAVIEVLEEGRRERPRYKKDGTLAKVPHVEYDCQGCGRWFKKKDIAVDHIDPVIHPERGFVDWNEFIDRLWCDKSNLQRLCKYFLKDKDKHGGEPSCHYKKTQEERKQLRKREKEGKIKSS